MKHSLTFRLVFVALFFPLSVFAQSDAAPPSCPLAYLRFDPGDSTGISIRVRNVSGKKIVGLTFNAALADATEHWKWLYWNFDPANSLREFGWNKEIKPGAAKTLAWDRGNLYFEHGGGGAFVLSSVLFEDGSSWEEPINRASCVRLWHNNHKKGFARPVVLPLRR